MKFYSYLKHALALTTLLTIYSCETDDVSPAFVQLAANQNNFSENAGTVVITATLNGPGSSDAIIDLVFGGTATRGTDYSVSANQLTIPAGATSGSITLTAIQDTAIEGVETIEIATGIVTNVASLSNFTISLTLLDDDADSDGDGVLDADDECVDVAGDPANNGCPFLGFIINEVNYDPADGIAGDANGDTSRDPLEDEFVEFFNSGPALDISGYRVFDADALSSGTPRHIFPAGTVVPLNGAIVLFGGGTPSGSFGGSLTQTASGGQLNLNNAGDLLTLQDAAGNTILTFDVDPLSNNPNESYTRNPDLTGQFEQHSTIPNAGGRLFSPGTRLDGSSF